MVAAKTSTDRCAHYSWPETQTTCSGASSRKSSFAFSIRFLINTVDMNVHLFNDMHPKSVDGSCRRCSWHAVAVGLKRPSTKISRASFRSRNQPTSSIAILLPVCSKEPSYVFEASDHRTGPVTAQSTAERVCKFQAERQERSEAASSHHGTLSGKSKPSRPSPPTSLT